MKQTVVFENLQKDLYNVDSIIEILKLIPYSEKNEFLNDYFTELQEKFIHCIENKKWERDFYILLKQELQDLNPTSHVIRTYLTNLLERAELLFVHNNNNESIKGETFDLAIKLNQEQKELDKDSFFIENDFYESFLSDNYTEEEVNHLIFDISQKFKLKDIVYSRYIPSKYLVKTLVALENSLKELYQLIFENNQEEFHLLNLNKYTIAIGLKNETYLDEQNNILFLGKKDYHNFDKVIGEIILDKIDSGIKTDNSIVKQRIGDLKRKFIEHLFSTNPIKREKFVYIKLFSEYLYDLQEVLKQNQKDDQSIQFIEIILNSIQEFLNTQEIYDLNAEKSIYYYKSWEKNFKNLIENNYFAKKTLENNIVFKKEIFKFAIIFKYLIINNYKFSFWKDLVVLDLLTDLFVKNHEFITYDDLEELVFKIINDKETFKIIFTELFNFIFKRFFIASWSGFKFYYRSENLLEKLELPYLQEDQDYEKDFWEKNLEDIQYLFENS